MNALEAARRFYGDWVTASAEVAGLRIADAFASIPREDFLGLSGDGWWLSTAEV